MGRLGRVLLGFGVLAAVALTSGCGANYYGTMRTGRPPIERAVFDELGSAKRVGVAPLTFAKVRFRNGDKELTEDEAFAGKSAEKRASWDEDKKAMTQILAEVVGSAEQPFAIAQVAGPDASDVDFVVVPEATLVDPGYFATYLFNAKALLVVHFTLVRASDKKAVYEWTEREESGLGAASGTRMRAAALQMGFDLFLTLRAGAKPVLAEASAAAPKREAM